MADVELMPTPAAMARIFVALQEALRVAGLRPQARLARPENLWALAVLLSERLYLSAPEADYRIATAALGSMVATRVEPLGPALVRAGDARDRPALQGAIGELQRPLRQLGIELLESVATEGRLQAYRQAAARIVPQPALFPTLETVFSTDPFRGTLPARDPSRRDAAAMTAVQTGGGWGKALAYGAPALGGLFLVFGAYRYWQSRKGVGHAA